MASSRGVHRVLDKLEASINDGKFYEAHQMYRTLYFRYNTQQKYTEAKDLLYRGSLTLLGAHQLTSGADLALLFVDTLVKSDTIAEDVTIGQVTTLHEMMDPDSPERTNYVSVALKWSQKHLPEARTGHPVLHKQFAINFWREKNLHQARYHFLHSLDGESCASMLIEYHITAGFPSEADLFIAQAVLQFLCLRNKVTADVCFSCYTKQHPQVEAGPPFVRPLLNFLWMLLLAIDGGKVAVFTILVEKYQPSLKRDPTYNEYLDRIGQIFFGLPPPQQSGSGVFGNLLQSLFGGEEDEEVEESSPQSAALASSCTSSDIVDKANHTTADLD